MKRKELLKALKENSPAPSGEEMGEFDRLALRGLRKVKSSEDLDQISQRLDGKIGRRFKPAKRLPIRRMMTIAASVAVLILAWNWLGIDTQPSTDYAFMWSPTETLSTVPLAVERSEVIDNSKLRSEAAQAYSDEEFALATARFEAYLQQQPEDRVANFYLAHSLLQLNSSQAIEALGDCAADSQLERNFRDYAEWFLAWALFHEDRMEEAEGLLNRIRKSASICHSDAEQLWQAHFAAAE